MALTCGRSIILGAGSGVTERTTVRSVAEASPSASSHNPPVNATKATETSATEAIPNSIRPRGLRYMSRRGHGRHGHGAATRRRQGARPTPVLRQRASPGSWRRWPGAGCCCCRRRSWGNSTAISPFLLRTASAWSVCAGFGLRTSLSFPPP
jgi:hypothetical protein